MVFCEQNSRRRITIQIKMTLVERCVKCRTGAFGFSECEQSDEDYYVWAASGGHSSKP